MNDLRLFGADDELDVSKQYPNVNRMFRKSEPDITAKVMRLWQKEPVRFAEDSFDFKPDTWQEDVMEDYKVFRRILMLCSKGPGKTCLLAILGWHFFLTTYLPKLIAVAISRDHLMAGLWAELHLWRGRSKFAQAVCQPGSSRITLNGHEKESFIDARSFKQGSNESDQAAVLSGFHADNIAVLGDEFGDVEDAVIVTLDAILAGEDGPKKKGRVLVTANPTRPHGLLYRASRGLSKTEWKVHHVNSDPENPKRAKRVSVEWAQAQIDEYGRDHDWVRINIFGQYPLSSSSALLTELEIEQSQARKVDEKSVKNHEVRLGLDVSRGGLDSSVIVIRQGPKVHLVKAYSSSLDSTELASQVMLMCGQYKVDVAYIDDTGGWGSGVVDALQFQKRMVVVPINYGARADDDVHYFNKRSEMYVRLRDWAKARGQLPDDHKMKEDLLCPELKFFKGRFNLESKEDIRKRLGRSPDRSDALAQTFADEERMVANNENKLLMGSGNNYVCGLEDEDGGYNPHGGSYESHNDDDGSEW